MKQILYTTEGRDVHRDVCGTIHKSSLWSSWQSVASSVGVILLGTHRHCQSTIQLLRSVLITLVLVYLSLAFYQLSPSLLFSSLSLSNDFINPQFDSYIKLDSARPWIAAALPIITVIWLWIVPLLGRSVVCGPAYRVRVLFLRELNRARTFPWSDQTKSRAPFSSVWLHRNRNIGILQWLHCRQRGRSHGWWSPSALFSDRNSSYNSCNCWGGYSSSHFFCTNIFGDTCFVEKNALLVQFELVWFILVWDSTKTRIFTHCSSKQLWWKAGLTLIRPYNMDEWIICNMP